MKKEKIVFGDCYKTFTTDQDKAITPEETLRYFYKQVDSLQFNILNEVRRIDNGRLGIPVYFSVCGDDAAKLTGTKKQMGKGASPIQAEASACMELAERFSFFSFKNNDTNFLHGDYISMENAGYPVLGLSYLLQSVHDATTSHETLRELLRDIPMQWVWATNLTRDSEVLLPFSWFFAINEFNGPSAGNTREEAALQGICEIVERHVCALINHGKRDTPRIDSGSVTDPIARELLQKFSDNNIELYLNDFTLDTGIPTVAALAIDRSTFPGQSEIVYTAGTASNPEKALIRAVTEVAQLAGDFNTGSNYIASGLPKPLKMEEVAYLTDTMQSIEIQAMADIADNNMKIELDNCLRALQAIGLDVFMIEVTNPELKIPAMYTIVPGAHFRERSMINNVGLFAAKLTMECIDDPQSLDNKLQAMEKLLPESYFLEFYRGRNYADLGFPEMAIKNFYRALELQPEQEDLPYIYSYLGSSLKELGHFHEAIDNLQKGLAEDEERPDIHNSIGVCFFKLEEYQKAIHHFQRAIDLNPASGIDYANLGVNYHRVGDTEKAAEYLMLALTLDPSLTFAKDLLNTISADLK